MPKEETAFAANARRSKTLIDLWRGKVSDAPLSKGEIDRIAKSLLTLQRGLTGERRLAGAGYMDATDALGAYLLYYYGITHRQITLALNSIIDSIGFGKENPVRILDVGAGPAPAAMAIVDILLSKGLREENLYVNLIDSSPKALNLAKKIFARLHPRVSVESKVLSLEKDSLHLKDSYDFVVASHVFNELWKNAPSALEKRFTLVERLTKALTAESFFLLSDPALLQTSREMIALVSKATEKGLLHAVSPCPVAFNALGRCPLFSAEAPESATCHATITTDFDATTLRIANAAGLKRDAVKMTFFALKKGRATESSKDTLRVVSDGMLNKSGRVRFLLCDGKKRFPISAKNADPHAKNLGFFSLQRYDAIAVNKPQLRGDTKTLSWGISAETEIRITPFSPRSKDAKATLLQAKSRERKFEKDSRNLPASPEKKATKHHSSFAYGFLEVRNSTRKGVPARLNFSRKKPSK